MLRDDLQSNKSWLLLGLFVFYTIVQVLDKTEFVALNATYSYRIALYSSLTLILMLLLSSQTIFYSVKNVLVFSILIIYSILLFEVQGYNIMFFSVLSFFIVPSIGINRLIKWNLISRSIVMAFVIIMSLLRFIPSGDALDSSTGILRRALGFSNPNGLAESAFVIGLELLIVARNHKKKQLLIPFSLLLGVMWIAKSRTVIIISILAVLFSELLKGNEDFFTRHIFLKKMMALLPIICFILSYYLLKVYNSNSSSWIVKINDFMSNRLLLGNYYLNNFTPTLFGERLSVSNLNIEGHFFSMASLDNGYISLLLRYGYVSLILILIMIMMILKKVTEKRYIYLLPAVCAFTVIGLSETGFYLIAYNFTLYFWGIYLDGDKKS